MTSNSSTYSNTFDTKQEARAVRVLRAGKPVAFPTDTVYGLGVSVLDAESCAELFRIKHRPEGKPVAWLVGSVDDLLHYGKNVPVWAIELAQQHWPGALTLIVNASEAVPHAFQSEEHTIGLRMPNSPEARALIAACGCPLATTSANISGKPAAQTAAELDESITSELEAVVSGTVYASGVASTVVDCTKDTPIVLRQGTIKIA